MRRCARTGRRPSSTSPTPCSVTRSSRCTGSPTTSSSGRSSSEPERAWQRLRVEAARAGDWITVDSLAHVAGRGILSEPYRWAELEQLVYSPSRWERRLVGSTIATIPHVDRRAGREPDVAAHALPILARPDRRRRPRRPEGHLLGAALDERGRPRRHPRLPPPRGRHRRARRTTATGRGSSATRSRSCRPRRRPSSGRPPWASGSARERPRPPAPRPPPPRSPGSG